MNPVESTLSAMAFFDQKKLAGGDSNGRGAAHLSALVFLMRHPITRLGVILKMNLVGYALFHRYAACGDVKDPLRRRRGDGTAAPFAKALFVTVMLSSFAFGAIAKASVKGQTESKSIVPGVSAIGDHYSDSTTINARSVSQLGLAWEFKDFVVRGRTHHGMEATPMVVDGVMYVSGPWSVVYALDATTGHLLWQFDPQVDGEYARRGCCDVVNRGVAVHNGVVYDATFDGYLVALDARSGKPLWKADTFIDRSKSYTSTGAPVVAGPNVLIGNGGAEMGVRGYTSAYELKTGKLAWRFFSVPGDPATPDEHPELTAARKTWAVNSTWDLGGGGTPWDSMVYDGETNLVLIGTGNGSPHAVWQRSPGNGENLFDNLYLSSIVAVDATSGRMKWFYQETPHDSWDYTATQNMILADLRIKGTVRKVVMHAPKNGFFYVIDRVTGELLSADKYSIVTWADHVDLKTGRPAFSAQSDFSKEPKLIWPGEAGAHNWQPMAFNPKTGLVYIPTVELPMLFQMYKFPNRPYTFVQGTYPMRPPYHGAELQYTAGQPQPVGENGAGQTVLKAWDPVKKKEVWAASPTPYFGGGALTTSTGLVIQGNNDGRLSFFDAASGRLLHSILVGTGIGAAPMIYTMAGIDYLAFTAGSGGSAGHPWPPGAVARERENYERAIVLKLGGTEIPLPPVRKPLQLVDAPAQYRGSAEVVKQGQYLYLFTCSVCHGKADTVGAYPNLWTLTPEEHAMFNEVVLKGVFKYGGMASFADILSEKDVEAIHAYISDPSGLPSPTVSAPSVTSP
jgi:quinohemoprotein ethanol dehydrogenase